MPRSPKVAWALLLSCTLVHLLSPHWAFAQGDHRLIWRTLTTEHFDIHYHEPLGILARWYASRAEAVNARVERSLGLSLSQRVQVVLADDDDSANGFAGPLPYNAIRLRAAAPDDMSPLSDYDDWPTTLLTHEHTHIVHLERASGLPYLLQQLFGRFYTPQQFLPAWLVEGLAVVEESEHTSAGRGRSTMFEMYLRADALEDRLLDIDWVSFDGEPWPHGNLRYLYGQAFIGFIAERHGTRALGRMVEEYGRRLVPYGINRALRRSTGHTFVELYAAFQAELRARAETTRAAVVQAGLVEGERLTFHGELTRSPRFLSADRIAYSVADGRHVPDIRLLAPAAPEPGSQRVVRVAGVAQLAPVPGSKRLVYSNLGYHRGRYPFQELYATSLAGTARVQLTHALRAREPDVSRDGRWVAFVTQSAGTSHLEVAALADVQGTHRVVVRSRRFEQVYTPRWSPDGSSIAYSAWSRGGYRDIWLLELATGARRRITYDRAVDRGPVFSPDGRTLYFASDRTGISNLYAYDLASRELQQITNVVTGAFQPDVAPDGRSLVYVGYTAKGFDLFLLSLSESAAKPALPAFARPTPEPLPQPLAQPSHAYRPWATLYPRAYELSTDDVGHGTRLALQTSGQDAVGFHGWSLFFAQDLDANERGLEAGYVYRRPRFPIFLRGSVGRWQRQDFVVNGQRRDWDARSWSLALGTNLHFPRPLSAFNLRADYALGRLDAITLPQVDLDPNFAPPSYPPLGFDARSTWTLSHSSTRRQPFDISTSWGHNLALSATLREPYIGSVERGVGLSFRAVQFQRFAFRESVLAMAYTGAWRSHSRLGGYPARIAPILDALLGTVGSPAEYARLRGFPERSGDQMQVVQLEYRALISRVNRGLQTLPLFARRVHAAVFTDVGDAYDGAFDLQHLGVGVGAELRLDWASGYSDDFIFRAGVAQGLTKGGTFQWYTTLAQPF